METISDLKLFIVSFILKWRFIAKSGLPRRVVDYLIKLKNQYLQLFPGMRERKKSARCEKAPPMRGFPSLA
jgi:hypothetical protein